jgi:hypothetical protein
MISTAPTVCEINIFFDALLINDCYYPKAPGSTICVKTSPSVVMPRARRGYPIPDQTRRSSSTETGRGYGLDFFSDGQRTRSGIQR